MPVTIPFSPSIGNYRFGCTIGSSPYLFDVVWNARDGAWYFDLLSADQTQIYTSIKIVIGTALGRLCVNPAFPSGVFEAIDLSGAGLDAGFDDLGTRVVVYYYTAAEFAAL
jgi:hypothetical protein